MEHIGGRIKNGVVGLRGELTALHLVAHVPAVVPAITLQVFVDADASGTGKHVGAGCSPNQRKEGGSREKKRRKKKET